MADRCEQNRAYLYDKGGEVRLGFLPATSIRWSRRRDDISDALVTVAQPDPECCQLLGGVEPGRHELVIYRGSERVWEGPITRKADSTDQTVTIEARDVLHYTYRCIIRTGYDDTYPNCRRVTSRAEALIRAELARFESRNPPINVVPHLLVRPGDANECRVLLDYQKTLWEELDSFARYSGLDYTAIGRTIALFDTHDDQFGRTPTVTEADFLGPLVVTSYGMELATYAAATDGEGHWGSAGGGDPYYGLVEQLHTIREEGESAAETPSRESLIASAKNYLRGRNPTPAFVRVGENATINPAGVLSITNLVPGTRIPLRANLTCRTLVQEQKLDQVTVTEDGGSAETIQVSMSTAPDGELLVPEDSDQGEETT